MLKSLFFPIVIDRTLGTTINPLEKLFHRL